MKKSVLRFCAGLLAVILLSVTVVPCYAVTDEYTSTGTFWSSLKNKWFLGPGTKFLIGQLADSACSESPDSRHHGSLKTYAQNSDGSYTAICNYCSAEFLVYDADLSAAYNDYVTTLPAAGYTSSGGMIWYPTWKDVGSQQVGFVALKPYITFDLSSRSSRFNLRLSGSSLGFSFWVENLPVHGLYRIYDKCLCNYQYLDDTGQVKSVSNVGYYYTSDWKRYTPSGRIGSLENSIFAAKDCYVSGEIILPSFEVIPDTVIDKDTTYSTTTRPTSITGGNYGIVGDNNQMTKVEDNSTIVNETNNTYYNPATGVTVPITNWSYDYSDRSYRVDYTTSNTTGDTVTNTSTITYGDEYITIQEIDNSKGDTITNNYTIYYLIDGSGSQTPVDPPAACEHTWTETSTTPATCTMPGSKLSTCSKCQQTKKEAVPALGHDWQVKQTVTTEYDDTGQLVQQGYTIFECSRCHEQYKSTDGTAPPGGGSGTDPGEDKETIWQKLGKLIGAIGSGAIGLIEAALGKLLDALIALVEGMMERLKTVVEAILSIFDELPQIFGGFLAFLTALFPFLPPELMTILTFGILAVVFIGIIKAVRR